MIISFSGKPPNRPYQKILIFNNICGEHVCLCSSRFLKTPHEIIYSCMYSYLFDLFSEKPLSKAKYIYKLIRPNSVFGSMVNVPLFEN